MKGVFVAVALSLVGVFAFAQGKPGARITGRIIDANTKKPVEYATITITDKKAGLLNGSITNTKGVFEIAGVQPGNYELSVEFIGYRKYKGDSVIIVEGKKNQTLGDILLTVNDQTLANVTVTSKANIIENKIDKIVYNVANDVTSQGGVALDVLKKVPQVTVDLDGNVELQGSSSIRFLINGKPSSVFGNNLADALASIPASQIKSIEAITSPGAKYDAQGTGGIINIILKDSKVQGYNGSINFGLGTRLENVAINLNIRHHNFGVNVFMSGNAQLSSHTPNSQDRLSVDTAGKTNTHLVQDGYFDFLRSGYQGGLGFDWTITKKDVITGSVGFNHFANQGSGLTTQQQNTVSFGGLPVSSISSSRNALSKSGTHSMEAGFNYKKKFRKDGQELEFQYSGSFGNPNAEYNQAQYLPGQPLPYIGSYSINPGTDREHNFSLDYVQPVSEKVEIETGFKTILDNITSSADVFTLQASSGKYLFDAAQSYSLRYKRTIFAGYVSGSFPIGEFLNVKTGLRWENTNTQIDFPNTVIPSYNSWVPSAIISHNFGNGKTLKLAYSHRIERPEYREVNPFVNFSDPYNITTGNPLLQPELGNNFELGYNKSFDNGGSFYIALASRFNSHDIKPYTQFYPVYKIGDSSYTNVSVSTRMNIGLENRTGLIIFGSYPVTKKLSLRTNMFISNRHIVNELNANSTTNGFDARFNLNATYQLNPNLVMEGFGTYNPPVNNIQGKQPQNFTYTFGLRKFFLNKKASFGFTAINPFNQYISQATTVTTGNYSSYSLRQIPYRSFGISFSYKFGKLEFKKTKEEENSFINNPGQGN